MRAVQPIRLAIFAALSLALTVDHARAQPGIDVEAVGGAPFGVGRLTATLPPGERLSPLGASGFTLTERDGRVLYPAFDSTPVRMLLRDALGRSQRVTMYFLFVGREPLKLKFYAPTASVFEVAVRSDERAHNRLLGAWWREYVATVQRNARSSDYPTLVEDYLASMLASRLNLDLPAARPGLFGGDEVKQTLGTLIGAESVRSAVAKETMLRGIDARDVADLPLPVPVAPPTERYPALAKKPVVEEIAMHVPAECFYLRCGSFPNYQWFRRTLDRWGGDLRNLIATRGVDYGLNAKMEQRLSLKENALATLLGPQVIADVAIIGTDTFLREGASLGILFQAKSNFVLRADILKQRAAAVAANSDATDKTVKIGEHDVSLLSTPDGRIRSYYATDGDFHLVTTSASIVARFFAAGAGEGALGGSEEFQHARNRMPLERDDSLFIFLSQAFFRNVVSPQYRIEMTRRLQAVTDLELLRLAQLAARAEGQPADTVPQLTAGGFLPRGFGARADGSRLEVVEGKLVNSLRGQRGSFVPLADMKIDRITQREANAYEDFARQFESQWSRLEPVMVTIRRRASETPDIDQITLDLLGVPLGQNNLGLAARYIGPASRRRVAPVAGDVASLELSAAGSIFGGGPTNHLFAGLRDSAIDYQVVDGQVEAGASLAASTRWYAGGWPTPGLLSMLGYDERIVGDRGGFARVKPNLWQRSMEGFQIVSPQYETLAEVTPRLRLIEAPRPAQAWVYVGDTANQKVSGLLNAFGYFRAGQVTAGNHAFLHSLQAQLAIPAEEALATGEQLLDARLVCPLGGKYVLRKAEDRLPQWQSTAWTGPRRLLDTKTPDDFQTPTLQWFRGLEADVALIENVVSGHAELMMVRDPDAPAPQPAEKREPDPRVRPGAPMEVEPEPRTDASSPSASAAGTPRLFNPPPIPAGENTLPSKKKREF